jgi:maltose alpha-D-glucosyltransferase/alpha-amylase
MRRLIGMRNRFKAFGRGSIEFITSDNSRILSFVRRYQDECILVVANLSRFCQVVQLHLAKYNTLVPEEVFGGNKFPCITNQPYTLSLGPHNTYWFTLKKQEETAVALTSDQIPKLKLNTSWKDITKGDFCSQLGKILPDYLKKCRWFGGKGKTIRNVNIVSSTTLSGDKKPSYLILVEISYIGAPRETYLLPVSFAAHHEVLDISHQYPQSVICEIQFKDEKGIMYDGAYDKKLRNYFLKIITDKQKVGIGRNRLIGSHSTKFRKLSVSKEATLESRVFKGEQSNTSILYGDSFFFKLYRRLEGGINPDVEISRYLTEYTDFSNFPAYVGSLMWQREKTDSLILGLLLKYVPNESDAWTYTLESVSRYLTQAVTQKEQLEDLVKLPKSLYGIGPQDVPQIIADLISPIYINMVSLLAKRTAELHLALASLSHNSDTAPEPFSILYQKSVYQSMRALTLGVFTQIESNLSKLSDEISKEAKVILEAKQEILKCFGNLTTHKISAMKIRIHGDYHLGQVLYTGNDFIIIDFEGEPARPLSERRLKRSALRDVAGMMRSFHYAAHGAVILRPVSQTANPEDVRKLLDLWYQYVSGIFLHSYLETAGEVEFLPRNKQEFEMLLGAFLLEKAIYELGYELNNRPDWLMIPIRGVQQLLKKKL